MQRLEAWPEPGRILNIRKGRKDLKYQVKHLDHVLKPLEKKTLKDF